MSTEEDIKLAVGDKSKVLKLIIKICFWLIEPLCNYLEAKEQLPDAAYGGLKFYINAKGQFKDPCNELEIENSHAEKINLLEYFLSEIKGNSKQQYYVVLADSGMGKSTFLIKLYKKLLLGHRKVKVRYFQLALMNQDELKKSFNTIKKKNKTVLLLDSFDENEYAMRDYDAALHLIEGETRSFYKVIMTARTQFFRSESEEPKQISVITQKRVAFGQYKRIYMSPFEERDIDDFLRKRFKHKREEQELAKKIIRKCPKLAVRPILLSYIDILLPEMKNKILLDISVRDIYKDLVEAWIRAEGIVGIKDFLKEIAQYMYENGKVYLNIEEIKKFSNNLEFKSENLREVCGRSRTLLNRNATGFYKFAHKSILEYFIVENFIDFISIHESNFYVGSRVEECLIRNVYDFDMCKIFMIDYARSRNESIKTPIVIYSSRKSLEGKATDVDEFIEVNKKWLADSVLVNVSFEGADLKDANFEACFFNNVSFNHVQLEGSIFAGANIVNSTFLNCNLNNADMGRAKIKKVTFAYSQLTIGNLEGTDLSGSKLYAITVPINIIDFFSKKENAVEFFKGEAERDNRFALGVVGYAYAYGIGVTKSDKEAIQYFERSDLHYSAEIVYRIGREKKKMRYIAIAAENGCEKAFEEMCDFYEDNCSRDVQYWFIRVAQKGYEFAELYLGYLYEYGKNGIEKNFDMAEQWYKKAARKGGTKAGEAYRRLGDIRCKSGDYENAKKYYENAWRFKDVDAVLCLAELCEKQEDKCAWYEEAGKMGSLKGTKKMGELMYNSSDKIL